MDHSCHWWCHSICLMRSLLSWCEVLLACWFSVVQRSLFRLCFSCHDLLYNVVRKFVFSFSLLEISLCSLKLFFFFLIPVGFSYVEFVAVHLIQRGHEMRDIQEIMTIVHTENNHTKINIIKELHITREATLPNILKDINSSKCPTIQTIPHFTIPTKLGVNIT